MIKSDSVRSVVTSIESHHPPLSEGAYGDGIPACVTNDRLSLFECGMTYVMACFVVAMSWARPVTTPAC